MENNHHLLYNYLLSVYPKEYVDKIMKGNKDPAKYPWITNELVLFYYTFQNTKKTLIDKDSFKISKIIEEELAYALLLCQDSKCNPLNFIDYKK